MFSYGPTVQGLGLKGLGFITPGLSGFITLDCLGFRVFFTLDCLGFGVEGLEARAGSHGPCPGLWDQGRQETSSAVPKAYMKVHG